MSDLNIGTISASVELDLSALQTGQAAAQAAITTMAQGIQSTLNGLKTSVAASANAISNSLARIANGAQAAQTSVTSLASSYGASAGMAGVVTTANQALAASFRSGGGSARTFANATNRLTAALQQQQAVSAGAAASAASVGAANASAAAATGNAVAAATTRTQAFSSSMMQLRSSLTAMALPLLAVGGASTALFAAGVKSGADWNLTLLHIASNTGMNVAQMQQMKTAVQGLGANIGVPLNEIAEGYQHVANFGFRGADATKVMEVGLKASIATGAKSADVLNLLAGTMRNFGMESGKAANVMALLHNSADRANATMQQFNAPAGKAFASAKAYGVSLAEVAGIMTTFSQHQLPVNQGVTQITGLIKAIVTPAENVKKALIGMGTVAGVNLAQDFSAAGLRAKGLINILVDMDTVARAKGKNLEQFFSDVIKAQRGGLGAQMIVHDLENTRANVKSNEAAYKSATTSAWQYATANESLAAQTVKLQNNLQILSTEVNTALMPSIMAAINGVQSMVKWFTDLPKSTQDTIIQLAAFAGVAALVAGSVALVLGQIAGMAAGFAALSSVLATPAIVAAGAAIAGMAGPIGIVVVALGLLGAAWATNFGNIRGITKSAYDWLSNQTRQTMADMDATTEQGLRNRQSHIDFFAHLGMRAFSEAGGQQTARMKQDAANDQNVLRWSGNVMQSLVAITWNGIVRVVKVNADAVVGLMQTGMNAVQGHWSAAWHSMASMLVGIWDGMIDIVAKGVMEVGNLINAIAGRAQSVRAMATDVHPGVGGANFSGARAGNEFGNADFKPVKPVEAHHIGGGSGGLDKAPRGGGRHGGGHHKTDAEREAERAQREAEKEAEDRANAQKEFQTAQYEANHDETDNAIRKARIEYEDIVKRGVNAQLAGALLYKQIKDLRQAAVDKRAVAAYEAETTRQGLEDEARKLQLSEFQKRRLDAQRTYEKELHDGKGANDSEINTKYQATLADIGKDEVGAASKAAASMSKGMQDINTGLSEWINKAQEWQKEHEHLAAEALKKSEDMYYQDLKMQHELGMITTAQYRDELAKRSLYLKRYSDDWLKNQRELFAANKELTDRENAQKDAADAKLQSHQQNAQRIAEKFTGVFENAFTNLFEKGPKAFFKSVLDGFTQMLEKMLAELLAKAAIFALLDVFTGGGASGILGKSFGGFIGNLGFDDGGNDRKAQTWGFDYAQHFTNGMANYGQQRTLGQGRSVAADSSGAVQHLHVDMRGTQIHHPMDVDKVIDRLSIQTARKMRGYRLGQGTP